MALTPGTRLGGYEVLTLLGVGGMGEVYQARDTRLKRNVALKVLPDTFAEDADRLARFQREAELLATLNHPNIAGIYGLEESDDGRALVLELVEGSTLADRIAKGPIPIDDAVPIACQIAEALEAAHEHGVIHRDLKPANIKLTADGQVKVLDFGLAKLTESAVASGTTSASLSRSPTITSPAMMTNAGMILGTAAYMSPEQAKGRPADKRSDVWAFGCVLYEMLTGRPVVEGETVGEVLGGIFRGEPDWTRLPGDTPSSIRRLLRRCLQKDPRWRLPTAADARIELGDASLEGDHATPAVALRTAGRERFVWLAVVLLFAAATIVLAIPYFRRAAPSPEMRLDITTPPPSEAASFAISPDGQKLVFVAVAASEIRLWLRPLDSPTAQPLPGTEGASYPFWSADSRSVGFFASGKLKRIDLGGGLPQILADGSSGRGGAWNGDGIILFTPATGSALFRVPASGGQPIPVTKLGSFQVSHRFPQFLPDGRRFIFQVTGTADVQGIYAGRLDSAEIHRVVSTDTAGAYMPPGWLFFVRQATLVAQQFDASQSELRSDPVKIADSVAFDTRAAAAGFSVSPMGFVAYRPGGAASRQLTWFDRSGKSLGVFGAPDESLIAPNLSPDGTRAVAFRTVQNNTDVWLFDSARTTRFTFDAGLDQYPVWSHDGKRILFDSNRKGRRDLYWKSSDNSGVEEVLLESSEDKAANAVSPDDRFLLVVTPNNPTTGADLLTLALDGSRKVQVFLKTSFQERQGQFSPDGRWVAYMSNESGRYEIYIRPFPGPGGQWQVSTSGGIQPRWRRDGKELYFIAPDGKMMAAPMTLKDAAIDPGVPAALFQTRIWGGGSLDSASQQYDVAPDGRFLMNAANEDVATPPITLLLNWKRLSGPGHTP